MTMKSAKGLRRISGVVLAFLLLVAVAAAQEAPPGAQPLSVTFTGDSFEPLEPVPAGYYYLEVQGAEPGAMEYEFSVERLKEGATPEEAAERYEALNHAFMGEGNPGEAVASLTEVLVATGGNSMPPMAFELTPGEYLLSATGEQNFHSPFTVTEAEDAGEAPQADVTVDMFEFAFSIPEEVTAGNQTWQIQNVGEQIHHMILMRIHEDRTVDDVMQFLQTEEGEPPVDEVAYTAILSPGVSNFMTIDLQPGAYFAICFLPDYETGQPHFLLGMTDTFTVQGD